MGEAFVAVADDGNAISWNPAGLARMERMQVSFAYADLFGLGIDSKYASFFTRLYFIPPLTDYVTIGADWSGIKAGDEELGFSRDQFNFALAFRPPKSIPWLRDLSLGVNVKRLSMDVELDIDTELDKVRKVRVGGNNAWGWDIGVLYNLSALPYAPKRLHVGLMAHDVGGTRVKKAPIPIQPQSIRWGLSYRPFEDWSWGKFPISDPVLALDFDDRVHFGLEFWLARTLALRAGIQKDLHTNEKVTLSFGVGFKRNLKDWPEVSVDYALTDSPVLPNTNRQFGGSLIIKDNPRAIRIAGAQIDNVFASLYQHYGLAGASIGSIKLKNATDDTLRAWITFQAKPYTQAQSADTVIVPPGNPFDFDLRAVFNSDILYAREKRLSGEVKVTYEYRKNQYATAGAIDFALNGKNYLTWDDPGKAVAFVTTDEPLVKMFVEQARAMAPALEEAPWFLRDDAAPAIIIFNALKAYGIQYVIDEVTPFPALKDALHGAFYRLDTILYPGEFLLKSDRAGDCDDLSVLYASMLQYAGLPTALLTGPTHGHIFMMFDTNIPVAYSRGLPVSPKLFVKHNGTLWIPVETTMIPKFTFCEAWTDAANKIDSTWQIYEVSANQEKKYPPVKAGALKLERASPSIPEFGAALQTELAVLQEMKTQWLQKVEKTLEDKVQGLARPEAAKARNLYGVLLGQNYEYEQAQKHFKKVLQDSAAFAPAWNNLGNVEFITGNFIEAERSYQKALQYNRFSRGTYLDLAILYQFMKQGAAPKDTVEYQRKSENALLQAAQILDGDAKNAFALLQFPEERADGKAAGAASKTKKSLTKKIKDFIDKAFKKYLQKGEVKGVVLVRHGTKGRRELDEERTAVLAWIY
jgi:tetratricopeptide (TPR) repeat protein